MERRPLTVLLTGVTPHWRESALRELPEHCTIRYSKDYIDAITTIDESAEPIDLCIACNDEADGERLIEALSEPNDPKLIIFSRNLNRLRSDRAVLVNVLEPSQLGDAIRQLTAS